MEKMFKIYFIKTKIYNRASSITLSQLGSCHYWSIPWIRIRRDDRHRS